MAEERDWLAPLWDLLSVMSPAEAEAKVVARDPQAQALIDAVSSGEMMPEGNESEPALSGRFDPLRKAIYRNVLQTAQARPETATVGITRNLPVSGSYNPESDEVLINTIDPWYAGTKRYTDVVPTALHYQDTLSHELAHFLLTKMQPELMQRGPTPGFRQSNPKMPEMHQRLSYNVLLNNYLGTEAGQHDIIRYLQGLSAAPMARGPEGYLQPWHAPYTTARPFPELDPRFPRSHQDIFVQVLQEMLRDPQLLQKALAPFQTSEEKRYQQLLNEGAR